MQLSYATIPDTSNDPCPHTPHFQVLHGYTALILALFTSDERGHSGAFHTCLCLLLCMLCPLLTVSSI